jgi:methoxymalonate biosynthesis acyl carrier protein
MKPIKEPVCHFFAKHIKVQNLADDSDIFQLGLVNSLFAMQIVNFVEEHFAIIVDNEDLSLNNFRSINSICEFVARKLTVEPITV